MRTPSFLLLTALTVALAGCGSSGDGDKTTSAATTSAAAETTTTDAGTATGTDTTADAGTVSCRKVSAPKARPEGKLKAPTTKLDPAKTYDVVFTTSCGSFTVRLDVKRAPKTSASFASLAQRRFYDNTIFHRIVPNFVIQGGDPTQSGQGGPGYGVTEAPPSDLTYTRGVVAMAKTQTEASGRSGSQFYVVTGEDAQLPPIYALVGKVTRGQAVVDEIGVQPPDQNERPVDPVVIERARLVVR